MSLFVLPPLLPAAVALIVGIVVACAWPIWPCVVLGAILSCIAIVEHAKIPRHWLLYGASSFCAFMLGAGALLYQQQQAQAFHLQWNNTTVDFQGRVTDITIMPDNSLPMCVSLSVHRIKESQEQSWQQVDYTIQLYTHHKKNLYVDDTITVYKVPIKPIANTTFAQYLTKEGFNHSCFIHFFKHRLIDRPALSLRRALHQLRERIATACKQKMPAPTFAFFSAIFLGNKQVVKKDMTDVKYQFTIWGVAHILARSGLHLSVIILIWYFLLSMLYLPFFIKHGLGFLLILLYHCTSWAGVPFLRSLFTYSLYEGCLLLNIKSHPLHLFTLACIIMLMYNPTQLLFLDFQLSFGLTYALLWISTK